MSTTKRRFVDPSQRSGYAPSKLPLAASNRELRLSYTDHLRIAQDIRPERGPRAGRKSESAFGGRGIELMGQVNATPSDEAGIGDELGIMGVRDPGFRILTYEMSITQRYVFIPGDDMG